MSPLQFKLITSFAAAAVVSVCVLPGQAAEIKKCQDAEGNWHYGNFADESCIERGDVTKLNNKGSVVGVEKPPPTQEELDAGNRKKQEAERNKNEVDQQRKKDEGVVQIYGSEAVISSTRDRKLESIDNNLEVTRALWQGIESDLEELQGRKKTKKVKELIAEREKVIKSYDHVVKQSLDERDKLVKKYDGIMKSFQEASARLNSGN